MQKSPISVSVSDADEATMVLAASPAQPRPARPGVLSAGRPPLSNAKQWLLRGLAYTVSCVTPPHFRLLLDIYQ